MRDDSRKDLSGWYVIYRKLRYLNHRGTLLNKTPRVLRIKKNRRKRREFLRYFRCFRFRSQYRRRRLFEYQLNQSREKALRYLAAEPVPVAPPPSSPARLAPSFSERIHKLRRALKLRSIRKQRHREQQKLLQAGKPKKWYVRYRKIRYLWHTGQLFKVDRDKVIQYLEKKIFFAFRRDNLIIAVNSTAIFLLAYFFVYISKQFAVAIAANSLDIRTIIYYFEIDYLIRGTEWTQDAVKIVFSMGPFITLMISLIALIIYLNYIEKRWIVRTFVLWVFCHALIQFLGEVMAGTLLGRGFGWVLMYLYFADTANMIVSIVAVILLVGAGLFFSKNFLFTGNTYFNFLHGHRTNKFVFSQVIMPYLIGNVILILIKLPGLTVLELLINLSMLLLLLPAIIRSRFSNELFFDEEKRKIHPFYWWIFSAIAVLIAFRVIFGIGVRM